MLYISKNWILGRNVLISYPKSGRTWVRFIFDLANVQARFTHAGQGTGDADDIGRRFAGIRRRNVGRKTIFLHRNPIDTAISFYFQVHKKDFSPATANYEEKLRRLTKEHNLPPVDMNEFVSHPIWGVENICRFNRSWLSFLHGKDKAMIVSYEDLKTNPNTHLPPLLTFAGAVDFDIDQIIAQSSFDAMQRLEQTKGADDRLRLHGNGGDAEGLKVRKGKIGGYVDYLDAVTIERCRDVANRYGLKA